MSKKSAKFDALAYSVSKLGQPHEAGKDRFFEESHGLVSNWHKWRLPCDRWLKVEEWSDGDQATSAGGADWNYQGAARGNADDNRRPAYEARARRLIDAYAEAAID